MGIKLNPLAALLIAGGLLLLASYVFARVRSDYQAQGTLTRPVAAYSIVLRTWPLSYYGH